MAPSIKVKKFENLGNKIGLAGCKWSSLNDPGTQSPVSHSYVVQIRFFLLPFDALAPPSRNFPRQCQNVDSKMSQGLANLLTFFRSEALVAVEMS